MHREAERAYLWLYIGVSLTAGVLGYMVGASNSPVVGSVVPAAFGLILVAFGIFKGQTETVEDHSNAATKPAKAIEMSFGGIRAIGVMLTLFSIVYMASGLLGTEVRGLNIPTATTQFPWVDKNQPKDLPTTLEWLVVQKRLTAYGYTLDQVRQIYNMSQAMQPSASTGFFEGLLDHVPEPGMPLKALGLGAEGRGPSEPNNSAD